MSILTKILVVLATVLSLILVSLVIVFVNNQSTIRADRDDLKVQLQVAQNRTSFLEARLAAATEASGRDVQKLREVVSEKTGQNTMLISAVQQEKVQRIKTEHTLDTIKSSLGELTSAEDQGQKTIVDLRQELRTRRENELTLYRRNIELSSALQDANTERGNLKQQMRLFQGQLQQQEERILELEGMLNTSNVTQRDTEKGRVDIKSAVAIHGIITDVVERDEDTFIGVNVGSNDQVVEGMTFMIHRGDTFIGSAVITRVDLNSAAGRITLKTGDITNNLEIQSSVVD